MEKHNTFSPDAFLTLWRMGGIRYRITLQEIFE